MSYLIDKERDEAHRRLMLLARSEDPGTIALLERIGVKPGWRCLEVGAGAGTIVSWLAARVGEKGSVLATDIDTTFLGPLASSTVDVRMHDVATESLDREAFDLVHTRQVLMHLPERNEVLSKLAAAVRPGGWLLVEDVDASTDAPDPTALPAMQALYRKVLEEIYAFAGSQGLAPRYGQELFGRLRDLGFEKLRAEGRLQTIRGNPAEDASSHVPAFVELREVILARGGVTEEEFDEFLALTRNPEFAWREGMTIAAWGRKPRI